MICCKTSMARNSATKLISSTPYLSPTFHYRIPSGSPQNLRLSSRRLLSTGNRLCNEVKNDAFPPPSLPKGARINYTEPAWRHPVFGGKEMEAVEIAHRPTSTFSDKVALFTIQSLRFGMDKMTGYRHRKESDGTNARLAEKAKMTEKKWLIRIIFLESIAAVPGMVGGMLRHLHSLRRMKRDNGWVSTYSLLHSSHLLTRIAKIESLLEEAFNERMHLLTFLKLYSPGIFMRTMILGAQGVFFNAFFVCYLMSPATCHRFVGYLEEEAVITYTRALADMDAGKLPLWKSLDAPQIAITYWNMPEGHRKMRDLLLYVRADEAKHREVCAP